MWGGRKASDKNGTFGKSGEGGALVDDDGVNGAVLCTWGVPHHLTPVHVRNRQAPVGACREDQVAVEAVDGGHGRHALCACVGKRYNLLVPASVDVALHIVYCSRRRAKSRRS